MIYSILLVIVLVLLLVLLLVLVVIVGGEYPHVQRRDPAAQAGDMCCYCCSGWWE